jgi:hypothetical protein
MHLAIAYESPFLASRAPGRVGHLREVEESSATNAVLAGARIREVAVLLLASSANPTRPIHYQQWYRLFRDAGYGIDARDPVATFLTQISRSPAVRRADALASTHWISTPREFCVRDWELSRHDSLP